MERESESDGSCGGGPGGVSHYQLTCAAVKRISVPKPSLTCHFCQQNVLDELRFGPLYSRDGVLVHYFCMLFSSALCQNGGDQEGILGFLTSDIRKEVRRASRLKCVHCGLVGASVGCCNKRCRDLFHFPCGLQAGATFQFHGKYESFCPSHSEPQIPSPFGRLKSLHTDICTICTVRMSKNQSLVSGPCCRGSVFHKSCIQRMALSAGYFFKCPLCNDRGQFVYEMKNSGVYVPEQDAAWERDNSYSELYMSYSRCDAETCRCPYGREYSKESGTWIISRCRLCGAAGTHKTCSGLKNETRGWACNSCFQIERNAIKLKKSSLSAGATPGPSTPSSSGNTSTASSNEVPFRWKEVMINKKNYAYFPYSRQILKKLDHGPSPTKATLPDWRNLELRVQLVDWLPSIGIPYSVQSPKTNLKRNKKNMELGTAQSPRTKNRRTNKWTGAHVSKRQSGRYRVNSKLRIEEEESVEYEPSTSLVVEPQILNPPPAEEEAIEVPEVEVEMEEVSLSLEDQEENFSVDEVFQAYQSEVLRSVAADGSTGTTKPPAQILQFRFIEDPGPPKLKSTEPEDGIEIITIESSAEEEEEEESQHPPTRHQKNVEDVMLVDDDLRRNQGPQTPPPPNQQNKQSPPTPEQVQYFQAQSTWIRKAMESSSSPPTTTIPRSPSSSSFGIATASTGSSPLRNLNHLRRRRRRKQLYFGEGGGRVLDLDQNDDEAEEESSGGNGAEEVESRGSGLKKLKSPDSNFLNNNNEQEQTQYSH